MWPSMEIWYINYWIEISYEYINKWRYDLFRQDRRSWIFDINKNIHEWIMLEKLKTNQLSQISTRVLIAVLVLRRKPECSWGPSFIRGMLAVVTWGSWVNDAMWATKKSSSCRELPTPTTEGAADADDRATYADNRAADAHYRAADADDRATYADDRAAHGHYWAADTEPPTPTTEPPTPINYHPVKTRRHDSLSNDFFGWLGVLGPGGDGPILRIWRPGADFAFLGTQITEMARKQWDGMRIFGRPDATLFWMIFWQTWNSWTCRRWQDFENRETGCRLCIFGNADERHGKQAMGWDTHFWRATWISLEWFFGRLGFLGPGGDGTILRVGRPGADFAFLATRIGKQAMWWDAHFWRATWNSLEWFFCRLGFLGPGGDGTILRLWRPGADFLHFWRRESASKQWDETRIFGGRRESLWNDFFADLDFSDLAAMGQFWD